ncbi:unnamed protein product [Brachionus calyciflorus]|uniref:Uncharacterized protein n=1 Tax=Brachionus calyciflorus TaxID=104777 RepID=A0A813LY10_9BILA|nr:unnamed protein product [Brachionus calyciflorus]
MESSLEDMISAILSKKRYYSEEFRRFIDFYQNFSQSDSRKATRQLFDFYTKSISEISLINLKRLILIYLAVTSENDGTSTAKIQNLLLSRLDSLFRDSESFRETLIKFIDVRNFKCHFSTAFTVNVRIKFTRFLIKSISFSNLYSESKLKCVQGVLDSLYDDDKDFKGKIDRKFIKCNFGLMTVDEIKEILKYFDSEKVEKITDSKLYEKRKSRGSFDFTSIRFALEPQPKKIKPNEELPLDVSMDDSNKENSIIIETPEKRLIIDESPIVVEVKPEIVFDSSSSDSGIDLIQPVKNEVNSSEEETTTIIQPQQEDLNQSSQTLNSITDSFKTIEFDQNESQSDDVFSKALNDLHPYSHTFNLTYQNIPKLELKFINNFNSLKNLSINNCQIAQIDFNDLKFLNNLEILNLRNNCLTKIDSGLFDKFPKLSQIDLRDNKIQNLSTNIFKQCRKLKIVNLSNNLVSNLDASLFHMTTNLEEIDFSSNLIQNLNSKLLKNCSNLKKINFSKNQLDSLDENLFESNRNLSEIYFFSNKLKSLPKGLFRNLIFLKIINFSFNSIDFLSSDLFSNSTKLRIVQFSNNLLRYLTSDIFKISTELYLINLCQNQIESLPYDLFSNCRKLTRIYLTKNRIRTVDMRLFSGLTKLEEVNFSKNYPSCVLDRNFLKTIAPNLKFVS